MVHVVVTRSHDGLWPLPMTGQQWQRLSQVSCDCLKFRDAKWLRTYIAHNGIRSVCEYEAPFAQIIRDAFRESRTTFDSIWRANIQQVHASPATPTVMNPIIAEVDKKQFSSLNAWPVLKHRMQTRLESQGIKPLWTLSSTDGKQETWGFDASCPNAIDLIDQAIDLPLKNVWRSQLLMPNT